MCITENNPSEPCCDDPLKRCVACPDTDWKSFTWLAEIPAGEKQNQPINRWGGDILAQFPTAEWVTSQIEAQNLKMDYLSDCVWVGGALIAYREAAEGDGTFRESLYGFADAVRLRKLSTGWTLDIGNFFTGDSPDIFGVGMTFVPEEPSYELRGRFACDATNVFDLVPESVAFPDVYPSSITVRRIAARGFPLDRSYINQPEV